MDEVARFRSGVAQALGGMSAAGQRYPSALRRLAVSIYRRERKAGRSLAATATSLGIVPATLKRWTDAEAPGFRPVETAAGGVDEPVTVTTPGGLRIECPSVEAAARLVRALA